MNRPFHNFIQGASRWIFSIEKAGMALLMLILLGFALLQIILRNFLGTGYVWGDTLLRNIVLWMSLLGAVRATTEKKHIRIDLLQRLLPAKGSRVAGLVANCFSSLVSAVLCYASITFVMNERLGGYTDFLGMPYWWLEVIFPIAFGLMAVQFALHLIEGLFRGPDDTQP
jgi:TRAP-type C4-dicarboxylate transport system permease small subunit